MTPSPQASRQARLLKKIHSEMDSECRAVAKGLCPEKRQKLAPFLAALAPSGPGEEKGSLPQILSLCVQAPPELFYRTGVRHRRLACGSFAAADMAPRHLPALTCPMVKSIAGLLAMDLDQRPPHLVVPTTCDWVVKFAELNGLDHPHRLHFMELPHLREGEPAARRWAAAIKELKTWVEGVSGEKTGPRQLLAAITAMNRAAATFERLLALRRENRVPASHFALITNAFSQMGIEEWETALLAYIEAPHSKAPSPSAPPGIFLTGSPIVFPNYKMLELIENAGMHIAGDDICTMERAVPGATAYRDKSEYSLIKALADRHHRACTCPTFADNQRRMNRLVAQVKELGARGVIFHVLKGCHPFDMEAGLAEQRLKAQGIRYLKIETDYVKSDEQNIVTRLEAFGRSIAPPETRAANRIEKER